MKYYNWTKAIDRDSFQELVNFVNSLQSDEKFIMHFGTVGGNQNICNALIQIINDRVEKLIIMDNVYSAGMQILIEVKVPLFITVGVIGMYHYAVRSISLSCHNNKGAYLDDEFNIKGGKYLKKYGEGVAKKIFTTKEYKKYKKGKDVYLSFKRMRQIFPNAKLL